MAAISRAMSLALVLRLATSMAISFSNFPAKGMMPAPLPTNWSNASSMWLYTVTLAYTLSILSMSRAP